MIHVIQAFINLKYQFIIYLILKQIRFRNIVRYLIDISDILFISFAWKYISFIIYSKVEIVQKLNSLKIYSIHTYRHNMSRSEITELNGKIYFTFSLQIAYRWIKKYLLLTAISKDTQRRNLITIQTLPTPKLCCFERTDA